MKNLLTLLIPLSLVAVLGVAVLGPQSAQAEVQPPPTQQVLGGFCCDANLVRRCGIVNPVPVGNECFCPGQGYGVVCL